MIPNEYKPVANETLREKQSRFVRMVAGLIQYATSQGYELAFGEALRTKEQAELNARKGVGISNSLHCSKLAIDFDLFVNGVWQTTTEAHEPLGFWWESMGGTWGGRFGDGNHYSLAHGNRK